MINETEMRIQMLRHGDNNKSLAEALGKTTSTICCKLKGTQRFTQLEIQQIIDRYNLSPEETQTIFFAPQVAKSETNVVESGT